MNPWPILIVEDDLADLEMLTHVLRKENLRFVSTDNGIGAQEIMSQNQFAAVLLNLRLPDVDGISLVKWIALNWPDMLICVVTGHEDPMMREKAMDAGAALFFHKPYSDRNNRALVNLLRMRAEAMATARKRIGTHFKNPLLWFRGLFAAFISGGAGAFTAGPVAALLAPDEFNLKAGLSRMFWLMGSIFLTQGLLGAFLYLKQAPLPNWSTEGKPIRPLDRNEDPAFQRQGINQPADSLADPRVLFTCRGSVCRRSSD